jgi:hypothetical protein
MNQNLKVGQKFGVTKDYYVKEVIKTAARLRKILNNSVLEEPIGIVTKSGKLRTVSEAFIRSKRSTNTSDNEQLNRFYATLVKRGCFTVSYEPIDDKDIPIFKPEITFVEETHKEAMDAYNQGITIKGGAVTFNLIALVISLIAFKFFMQINPIYFYVGGGIVLLANMIFFIRFRRAKN